MIQTAYSTQIYVSTLNIQIELAYTIVARPVKVFLPASFVSSFYHRIAFEWQIE